MQTYTNVPNYEHVQGRVVLPCSFNDNYLFLHLLRYLASITIAVCGVVVGMLSIYVGTKMAGLEQSRLYLERDGLEAVLVKKKIKVYHL